MKVKKNVGNLFINNAVFNNFSNATAMGEDIDEELHLRDVIKSIDTIFIYDDVSDYHYFNKDTSLLEEDEDLTEEDEYLFYSDNMLSKLPEEITKTFTSEELLDRLYRINRDILTPEQINILRKAYKQKVKIDKSDVKAFLDMIQSCKRVWIPNRPKNRKFLSKYNIDADDCISILKTLTVDDYMYNTKSINLNHFGNNLMVFTTSVLIENVPADITVYIKIDVDESDNSSVVAISFHE